MRIYIFITILLFSFELSVAQDCENHCCENYGGSCCSSYYFNGKLISETDTFIFIKKENGLFLASNQYSFQVYHCDRQVVMPNETTIPLKGFIRIRGESGGFINYQILCDRHRCDMILENKENVLHSVSAFINSDFIFYPGFMDDFYPNLKTIATDRNYDYFYSTENKWILKSNQEDYFISKDGGNNYEKILIIDDSMGTEAIAKFASAPQNFTMHFLVHINKKGDMRVREIIFDYKDNPSENLDFYLF